MYAYYTFLYVFPLRFIYKEERSKVKNKFLSISNENRQIFFLMDFPKKYSFFFTKLVNNFYSSYVFPDNIGILN